MSRTICRFKSVVSWFFCAFAFALTPHSFGQLTLPPLYPINVPNFTIPFEVGESVSSLREVELFVSQDRGRRWQFVARLPVESGKFAYRADADGEYWFAFRRVPAAGSTAQFNGQPHLRVLVNTKEPIIVPPSQPSESGPIIPPRPERFRGDNVSRPNSQSAQPTGTEESKGGEPEISELNIEPERSIAEKPRQAFGPRLPGFDPSEASRNREGNLLDDLLSGMSPFMEVQPVLVGRTQSGSPAASSTAPAVSQSSFGVPGGITGIDLNRTDARPQPHVIVNWHTGHESWHNAQVDVLRSDTKEGPWVPIAINLPNNGEYWWFLTPEDLKPFYIAVRLRSFQSGTRVDSTQRAIDVGSRLAQLQR